MNLPSSKEETQCIIDFLRELSCCYRCIARFLGLDVSDKENAYKKPMEYFNDLLNDDKKLDTENYVGGSSKKLKKNTCPVCLDSFEETTVENFIKKLPTISIEEYNYSNFYFNVSFPKCLAIRAHSMYLHLKNKFPDVRFLNLYNNGPGPSLEQPHKIFRIVASEILSKALNKSCHPKSNLSLLLTFEYENDNLEVENIKKILKRKTSRKQKNSEVSRNDISELLKDINKELFKTHFPVPPVIPDKNVYLEKVDVTADAIYLGGRYLKFRRNIGQTPWMIDGVSVVEHNVQDIIFDALSNVLGIRKNDMTFTASGREDIDVRMLGTGRPFYIKIDNPKNRHFSRKQLLEVEKQIIESELVAVIKLQSIYASDTDRIKLGEEQKTKTYRALCKTSAPNVKAAVDLINKQEGNVKVMQKTVMRVLHRRTLLAREKIIYKMTAVEVLEHADLFQVELVTQAGTYVKEFVHGDFKRTEPNISSLLGYTTDMVALDCIDINLVWPENDTECIENSDNGAEAHLKSVAVVSYLLPT